MSYRYDIFLSYTRAGEAGEWVRNHFQPRFKGWLEQSMAAAPVIYWDRDIEAGEDWPQTLREALATSRILVPVLTHPYFRSRWCVAELNTMIARAQAVAGQGVTPERIIRPVRFWGNVEDFPMPVGQLQAFDMTDWAMPHPTFEASPLYIDFINGVKQFAQQVASSLPQAPPWAGDWPVRTPDPAPLQEVQFPQL